MNGSTWRSRLTEALVLVLAVGVVAHVVGTLLQPLLPALVALVVIGVTIGLVFRRY